MLYDALAVIALLLLATAAALIAGSGQVTAGKDLAFTLYLVAVWFLYLAWFAPSALGLTLCDLDGRPWGTSDLLGRTVVLLKAAYT